MMTRALSRLALVFALSFAAAVPLWAGSKIETPVKGAVLQGWQQADGSRIAALELTLTPGWKTYWRAPGDAGIPPQFDWSKSENLKSVGISWPTPEIFLTAGLRTIGYSGKLVLPLTLVPRDPGKPIILRAELDLGVCSDICVPHQMTLTGLIDSATTKPKPAIAAALAARPLTAREAGVKKASCRLTPSSEGFRIEVQLVLPSTGGDEVVVIEPGQPNLWMSETSTARDGGTLRANGTLAAEGGKPLALDRSRIRITVLGSKRAVDIQGCTSG